MEPGTSGVAAGRVSRLCGPTAEGVGVASVRGDGW